MEDILLGIVICISVGISVVVSAISAVVVGSDSRTSRRSPTAIMMIVIAAIIIVVIIMIVNIVNIRMGEELTRARSGGVAADTVGLLLLYRRHY